MSYWSSYERQPATQYTSGVPQPTWSSPEKSVPTPLSNPSSPFHTQYPPQTVYYGPGSPIYPPRYYTSSSPPPSMTSGASPTSPAFQTSGYYSSSYTRMAPSSYTPLSYHSPTTPPRPASWSASRGPRSRPDPVVDAYAAAEEFARRVGLPPADERERRILGGEYQPPPALYQLVSSRTDSQYTPPPGGHRRPSSQPPKRHGKWSHGDHSQPSSHHHRKSSGHKSSSSKHSGASHGASASTSNATSSHAERPSTPPPNNGSVIADTKQHSHAASDAKSGASKPSAPSSAPVVAPEPPPTDNTPVKVLQVNTSAKTTGSNSTKLADMITARLKARRNVTDFKLRDLAVTRHPPVDDASLTAFATPADKRTARQKIRVALDDKLIDEVQNADIIVLGVPMYNFHVSTQCKSWVDGISRAGVTFKYGDKGPEGLIKGKKVFVALARGGAYRDKGDDEQVQWLRQAFTFLGMSDIHFVYAEGLAMGDQGVTKAFAEAETELTRII